MFSAKYAFIILIVLLVFSPLHAQKLDEVKITILQDCIDELEKHPFTTEDVYGSFYGAGQMFDTVALHYRGAYALQSLINSGSSRRNWKVKTSPGHFYRNRREWNFNSEVSLRQKLAYDLFNTAGVHAVNAENVILYVNNTPKGLYTQFEDPDNKRWLMDEFYDNDGELYKAAFDQPNQTKFFADLTVLGEESTDYYKHYQKKMNGIGIDDNDYTAIIEFTKVINDTPDSLFVETLRENFETDDFIQYLVVSNFISFWDGYPVRPKNYWLYQNSTTKKWNFIPWDLNDTFETTTGFLNKMGTSASIFYQFDKYSSYELQENESKERPLVRRMMKFDEFRNAYIIAYKNAMLSFLDDSVLLSHVDILSAQIRGNISSTELTTFNSEVADMQLFINRRYVNVTNQLAKYASVGIENNTISSYALRVGEPWPNPVQGDNISISICSPLNSPVSVDIVDLSGRRITGTLFRGIQGSEQTIILETSSLKPGTYIIQVQAGTYRSCRKVVVF